MRCLILVGLLFVAGCSVHAPPTAAHKHHKRKAKHPVAVRVAVAPLPAEFPQANLPVDGRQRNWISRGSGSCGCASTISALRWNGCGDKAEQFRSICGGGQSGMSLSQKLDQIGVKYVATYDSDWSVLEWACRTRRQAVIGFKRSHICTLVGKEGDSWIVLDNNSVSRYETYSTAEFRQLWHGFAIVPMGTPAPPL